MKEFYYLWMNVLKEDNLDISTVNITINKGKVDDKLLILNCKDIKTSEECKEIQYKKSNKIFKEIFNDDTGIKIWGYLKRCFHTPYSTVKEYNKNIKIYEDYNVNFYCLRCTAIAPSKKDVLSYDIYVIPKEMIDEYLEENNK